MRTDTVLRWSRRNLLRSLTAAGGAGVVGFWSGAAAAEPPPETSTIRLALDSSFPILCWAPKFLAKELLRTEGFTDVSFVPYADSNDDAALMAADAADIGAGLATGLIAAIDRGLPITVLGGMHAGCTEVFATERVRSIKDLKGRRVAVFGMGGSTHVFVSAIAAHIGVDPRRDIEWVVEPDWARWPVMLESGAVDVVSAFPPETYQLHDAGIGHVILNTTVDAPWRNYLCCMVAARSELLRDYPMATKRALRALFKTNQLCAAEPERVARLLVDRGATDRLAHARRLLREVPYGAWRVYDPADTIRFFSLRLREAGIVKVTPREVLEHGVDFRFFDELRRELKA